MIIRCYTPEGQAVNVEEKAVTFRPAVYGILIEHEQVFLLCRPSTGLLYPPGGIVGQRETPTQAVRAFFRQLTGMVPVLGSLVFVEEQYQVEENTPWHLSAMYYVLERPSASAITPVENRPQPEWVSLPDLRREQLQFGYEAIQAAWLRLKLVNGSA